MITKSDLVKVDQRHLYDIYDKWPQYFEDASKIFCKIDHEPGYYKSIALCGMGGSATSCDILKDVLYNFSTIPCYVIRGQTLPFSIDKHSLVIINSVSGDTKETVSMMQEASEKKAEIVVISSGGQLKDIASKYGYRNIGIPNLCIPRASLPYLIMPGLNLVDPFLTRSIKRDISTISKNLSRIAKSIGITVPQEHNVAKKIADFVKNGFTLCFYSPSIGCVGTRFKNSLNENAKVHCIDESILEASHNEIVPFTFTKRNFSPKVVFLRWIQDRSIVNERFKKVKLFFRNIGQPFIEINRFDQSLINAIISSIYILDYSTLYIAIVSKIDPTPTPAIDILKKI